MCVAYFNFPRRGVNGTDTNDILFQLKFSHVARRVQLIH